MTPARYEPLTPPSPDGEEARPTIDLALAISVELPRPPNFLRALDGADRITPDAPIDVGLLGPQEIERVGEAIKQGFIDNATRRAAGYFTPTNLGGET